MKVHYINISLFALPLNILVYNQRNHNNTTLNTQTKRSLCECELFEPANYDNDPQMKEVMDNFNKQTQQRFHEYDERMKTTRQKCKEQCDKEIQKIILKDKLEKELMDKFATLQTDIQSGELPECTCEKSLADKVEKTCLKCAGVLGGGVAPGWGLISGIVYTGWKTAALAAATKEAIAEGLAAGEAAGIKEGIKAVMNGLLTDLGVSNKVVTEMGLVINGTNYYDASYITTAIYNKFNVSCMSVGPVSGAARDPTFCSTFDALDLGSGKVLNPSSIRDFIRKGVEKIVAEAKTSSAEVTKTTTDRVILSLTAKNTGEVNATYAGYQTPIIASIVAILVIVLVMVIIYLILRYRRKKKMKKKLQYIKLLEE